MYYSKYSAEINSRTPQGSFNSKIYEVRNNISLKNTNIGNSFRSPATSMTQRQQTTPSTSTGMYPATSMTQRQHLTPSTSTGMYPATSMTQR